MVDSDPPGLHAALLKWAQTFPISPRPSSLADLRDGHTLYAILHDIDAEHFPADALPDGLSTPSSGNWVGRWQNLKHIERVLGVYERDVCGVLDSQQLSGDADDEDEEETGRGRRRTEGAGRKVGPDLKAIAQANGAEAEDDVVALLKRILRAAMYSPHSNQRMGRVVMGLGGEVAATIAAAIASMDEAEYEEDAVDHEEGSGRDGNISDSERARLDSGAIPGKLDTSAGPGGRDLELEHEEKLIHAHRIIRQLEESNARAAAELEDLRTEKKRLEESFEALQFEANNGGGNGKRSNAEDDSARELRDRADRDRDYIAELEVELENAREAATSAERNVERLKTSSEGLQKLKDDVQLLRAERDELLSKTRANENLRKKIQNLQDAERATGGLREDLRAAQEELARLRGVEKKVESLLKREQENMNIIANTEQEIFDQKTTRKRLEHELRVAQQKFEIARDRQEKDKETIAELEERLGGIDGEGARGGLDGEMSRAEKGPSRAVSATVMTKKDGESAEVVNMLEERLKNLGLRNKSLEDQYLDVLGDKLGLETTLSEINEPGVKPGEDNIPYLEQRKKLQAATEQAAKLQSNIHALTAELSAFKERVLKAQGDADGLDAGAEYAALSKNYSDLTRHAEAVGADLAESRDLLRYALLSGRGINLETDEARKSKEFELVRQLLSEARQADTDEVVVDVGHRIVSRMETIRAEDRGSNQNTTKDAQIAQLKAELEELRASHQRSADEAKKGAAAGPGQEGGTAQMMSKEEQRAMAQLRRENQLMSSAWFDLTSRIQRDNIIVGRRRESPKSWLGKQRAAVGLGVSGVGR